MPGEKKRSKEEAERRKAIKQYAAQEDAVITSLRDKDAQYYSLNDVAVNFHKTGLFDHQYLEGFILFPDPISRNTQINMQSDLLRLINGGGFSLRHLIQYVVTKMSQDYWALLYWQAEVLIKQIKRNGTWNKADEIPFAEGRKITKDIYRAARHYRMHMARDLVQFVIHEFPPKYRLVLFEEAYKITKKIDSVADENYGIIFSDDKDKFELRKFSSARKYCW